jgi:hypothetical protein
VLAAVALPENPIQLDPRSTKRRARPIILRPTTTVVSRRSCSRATSPTGDTLPSRAFTLSLCRGTGLALLRAAGKVAEDGGERGAPAPTQWCHLGYLVTHWTSLILPMILVGRPAGVITSFLMFWVMGCWVSQAKSTS